MRPLTQFVCDTCGQIIKKPSQGWLEWIGEARGSKAHSFRICHHKSFSPVGGQAGCYLYDKHPNRSDMHLDAVIEHRTTWLLMFLDPGQHHEPKFAGPHVKDVREWVELARRLTIPYYEQARLYWSRAEADGFLADENEISIYSEVVLKDLIKEYGPERG